MKIRIAGLIALAVIIAFFIIACDNPNNGGNNNVIRPERSGDAWTAVEGIPFQVGRIAWGGNTGNEKFIAAGYGGNNNSFMAYSTDGITWVSAINYQAPYYTRGIAWGNGRFVAVGQDAVLDKIAYSENGIAWTGVGNSTFRSGKTVATSRITSIAWGGSTGQEKFIVGGYVMYTENQITRGTSHMAYSKDGITWTAVSSTPFSSNINSIAWGGNKFVAVGDGGEMAYSTDGQTWTKVENSPLKRSIKSIAWGNGKFVAGGGGQYVGEMAYSTDGQIWTRVEDVASFNSHIDIIAWGNNKFIAGLGDGRLAYSPDGINWTVTTETILIPVNEDGGITVSGAIGCIVWGNNKFVAAGVNKVAYWSGN
jgi:hypothetical protein